MSKLKISFKVKVNEQELSLAAIKPNYKIEQSGKKIHNRVFKEALEAGAMLRAKVDTHTREQNLWDDNKAEQVKNLSMAILAGEKKLAAGNMPLTDAKEIALIMRVKRDTLQNLLSIRSLIDQKTAEAQAEDAEFDYLVSACTVHNETGAPYFSGYEDYLEKKSEDYAFTCASKFALLHHGLAENFYMKLPENKFLKKYNFVNEDGRLVDKDGNFVDSVGRRVDEKGFYINEDGQRVDANNIPLDEDGNYVTEEDFKPFTDEDGNPIDGV